MNARTTARPLATHLSWRHVAGTHARAEFLTASAAAAALIAGLTFMLVMRARRPYPVPAGITVVVAMFMALAGMLATWAALSRFAA